MSRRLRLVGASSEICLDDDFAPLHERRKLKDW